MRILQIIDNISKDSGVSSFIMSLYRNIDKSIIQFDFLVASKRRNSFEEEIISLGGKVFYFGNPYSIKTVFKANKNAKHFFSNAENEYSLIHIHTPTMGFFTLRHIKNKSVNIILHSHSTMTSTNHIKALINSYLMFKTKKYATHYWACSSEAAYFLFGKNISMKDIFLAHNSVDVNKFYFNDEIRKTERKKFNIREKDRVFLHISNFSKIKNTVFLLEPIKQICKIYNNAFFIFVGNGPELESLKMKIQLLSINKRIFFIGRTDNVVPFLNMADALLLPSLKEGLPVTVVEAQATGLQCLVSDTVTKECNIGIVKFLPLEKECWISEMEKLSEDEQKNRKERSKEFIGSRFDISYEVGRIQEEYIKIGGKL